MKLHSLAPSVCFLAVFLTSIAASPGTNEAPLPAAASAAATSAAPAPATSPADLTGPEILAEQTAAPTPAEMPAAPAVAPAVQRAVFAQGVPGLSPKVLAQALDAVACARARGISARDDLLTVIDYSLPSTEPRLWVLDLARGEVLFHELVAHGSGSGDNYATRFSNVQDSKQTSLGLFRTAGTYEGGNGYSLKLQGLDAGLNDRAEARHIVMHGAWYVSRDHVRQHGRIGRSWGCPAVPQEKAQPVIDTIKGGSFVFSYSAAAEGVQLASFRSCPGAPRGTGTVATAVATAR